MTQAIEDTIKALKEFEEDLNTVKAVAADATKKLVKNAADWAESARRDAISEAQKAADLTVTAARAEGEREVESIRNASQASLEALRGVIMGNKEKAVALAVKRLLGGQS